MLLTSILALNNFLMRAFIIACSISIFWCIFKIERWNWNKHVKNNIGEIFTINLKYRKWKHDFQKVATKNFSLRSMTSLPGRRWWVTFKTCGYLTLLRSIPIHSTWYFLPCRIRDGSSPMLLRACRYKYFFTRISTTLYDNNNRFWVKLMTVSWRWWYTFKIWFRL